MFGHLDNKYEFYVHDSCLESVEIVDPSVFFSSFEHNLMVVRVDDETPSGTARIALAYERFLKDKNAQAFAGLLSANHISVNRGIVKKPTYEENVDMFNKYFSSIEFTPLPVIVAPDIPST